MAKKKSDLGDYFWRNGQKIDVVREEEFFTAIVNDKSDVEELSSMTGVQEVKRVRNRIFKIHIAAEKRDAAMKQFRSRKMGGICHHAYRPKKGSNTRYYLTDQIAVKFAPKVPSETILSILADKGARIVRDYPGMANTYLAQITSDAGMNPIKVANLLAEQDEVEYSEPNLLNRFQPSYTPTDTYFGQQWHLRAWTAADLVPDADVSATEAWDITRGSRDVVVAVIDDGFDLSHPDFSALDKVVHPKDYVDGDSNPYPVTSHDDYHGTPCASVALAEENGEGVVGIAPGCAFMPVRFPLSADDDFLWEIFDYMGKHADVISCSWGPPPAYAPLGQLMTDKFAQLAASGGPRKKGCVIVFAACNYNAPLNDPNNTEFEWYSYGEGIVKTVGPILNGLATHPDVIAVSASTSLNRKAAYSNWGKEICVCAPSDNGHPLNPYAYVPGRSIWTTDNEQHGTDFTTGSRYTGHFGGTSSATPLVAGVAGLVISANPTLTAADVKQILQDTADKIEDHQPDPGLGNEKGTYDNSGHSEWFGFGKVNAAKAVQRADELLSNAATCRLEIDAVVQDNLADTGAVRHYKVAVGQKLGLTLEGPEGRDFDLYVKRGAEPTVDDYDALGYSPSANEKVIISPVEPGDYYIMVRSYKGSGNFELKVALEQ